jgi:FtsH-binding integral membrane protein
MLEAVPRCFLETPMPFATQTATMPVILLSQDARSAFLRRTYTHLFLAVAGFVAFELFLFNAGLAFPIARGMLSVPWLLILGGFMVAGWLARSVAASAAAPALQYAALAGYVVAQGLIFLPVLVIASLRMPGVLPAAALTTIVAFAALTAVVFVTRKDFSFMRGILTWGGILALVLIVAATLFGFELGVFFSVAMVAFAGAAILYDTSNVLHHYPENRSVGAALELFASVALLFWYILRLFMSRR